ncbi:hypothetical protein L1049_023963 [Liquidambar formosana]|uniref:Uncharacterized protein n=1 Tax=Liquidambar formosana TaxID=63359 RepID=A0AAP0X0Y3_LIQFO
MAHSEMVNMIEHCQVTPPPSTVVSQNSLPLTFFDLPWLHFPPVQHLLFYEFPYSKAHFMQTTIPTLKHSLSLTLKHFYPLAGNLIVPPYSKGKPQIRYVDGDSVSLTFAESSGDFNNLTGNHARNVSDFQPLIPQLPPISMSSDTLVAPLLAIKVTLFPNHGICLGFTIHHALADGRSLLGVMSSWVSLTKSGEDEALLTGGLLPFYNRAVVNDPNGLENIFWTQVGTKKFEGCPPQNLPTNMVLATFVMGRADIQNLKKWVSTQCPKPSHVSSFTAREKIEEEVGEDELDHFVLVTDGRAHLDPPIPPTYFGNCLLPCLVTAKSRQLIGEDGFLIAAEAIGNAIRGMLHNEEGVLKGAEKWLSNIEPLQLERIVGVAGSPRFSIYDMDFGWGKPKKCEITSITFTGAMSLNECRDVEGDLEVGLSFRKIKMEAFTAIFSDGFKVIF